MADTPFFRDEFNGAAGDLGSHVPDVGTGWNTVANAPGTINMQLDGAGNLKTADLFYRFALGRNALGSLDNSRLYGEMTFFCDAAATGWTIGCELQFDSSTHLGAQINYTGSATDLYASGPPTNPLVHSWPGSPSAVGGPTHTLRWELELGVYSLFFDGALMHTENIASQGWPSKVTAQPQVTIQGNNVAKVTRVSFGRFGLPPATAFWKEFNRTEETI